MKIDAELCSFCKGCKKMSLVTHTFYAGSEAFLLHDCEHKNICMNAVYQYRKNEQIRPLSLHTNPEDSIRKDDSKWN